MRTVRYLAIALVVVGLLLAGFGLLFNNGPVGPNQAQAAEPKHPHIRRAINALAKARDELKEANHDFGGHRKDALLAVDRAINQLEKCLKY